MNKFTNNFIRLFQEEDETPLAGGIGTAIEEGSLGATPPTKNQTLDFSSEDTFRQFVSTLPEDIRERDLFKNTKSFESLAKQTLNAQSALGHRRLVAPQADWGDNEWNEFVSNIRPETPDAYKGVEKVSIPIDGEEEKEYTFTESSLADLQNVAHDLGIPERAFPKLQQKWAEYMVKSEQAVHQMTDQAVKAHVDTLREEWGSEYGPKHRAANEAFEVMAQQIPELNDLVSWSPLVSNHPAVMKLFEALSPHIKDMGMDVSNSSLGGNNFGQETVASLRSELEDIAINYGHLINVDSSKMATLSPQDKAKRQKILQRRSSIYQKLYSEE